MIFKKKKQIQQSLFEESVVLKVEKLNKKFCISLKRSMYYGVIDIIRSMFKISYNTEQLRKGEFWALNNVNLELKKGDTLGIIGVNGSGKSTLLRLITGIFPPDKGKISFKGRIGALIAVGAGFHPHMTGKENIYLNGTILGMSRKELDKKINDIVEFAEIGDFVDAPVSTYSSGMRVRLGFAIAVHCEPDILLVDEVLSVGDLSFRNKALRKMSEFKDKANALIFISHNLDQIRVLCNRVIILEHGEVIYDGSTDKGIITYENNSKDSRVEAINSSRKKDSLFRLIRTDKDKVLFNDTGLLNKHDKKINEIRINQPLNVFVDFTLNEDYKEIYFTIGFVDETNSNVFLWVKSNDLNKVRFLNLKKGNYRIKVSFSEHHLGPGVYFINYHILNGITGESYNHGFSNFAFSVKSEKHYERGIVAADEKWELENLS